MIKNKKLIIILSATIIGLSLLIGGTLAFFGWEGEESSVSVNVSSGDGSCTLLSDNNVEIFPSYTKNEGRIIKLSANQKMATHAYVVWNLEVNEINGLQDKTFKYELINNTTGVSYGSGNFENITNIEGSNTIIFSSDEKLEYNVDYEFILYLWIDGTIGENPISMADQIFDFDMFCDITGTEPPEGWVPSKPTVTTAVQYITNLYTNEVENNAVLTTNNGATGAVVTYNYAPIYDNDTDGNTTGGLINDRLGGTTSDYNAGNVRYYGANPSNYIYFNCDTYPDTNCELWRIIGVFKDIKLADGSTKDLIKIAHSNVSSTTPQWDDDSNDWHNATLQSSLNTTYYNGTVFNGLKGITASTKNKIEEVIWNLGGWNTSSGVYPNKLYEYERGDVKCSSCTYDTTWPGKIALMYPSDYGYATDLSVCKKDLYNYDTNTNCKGKDWLFKSGSYQWLLTSYSGNSYTVWRVNSSGFVNGNLNVNLRYAVRPVLYLDSEQIIESGSGTSGDPYKLSA